MSSWNERFEPTPDWRPDYGGLRVDFDFDPLPYGVGGEKRSQFKQRVRAETKKFGFILTGEVRVRWELFVDEQDRWETDTGADVDNFAKLLDDAITGPDGLLVDDTQVQRLEVAWLSAHGDASFYLTISCHPDELLTRPLALYELGDGLWYPISDEAAGSAAFSSLIYFLDYEVRQVKRLRFHMRQAGGTKRQAFEAGRYFAPSARGFHHTRAVSSGYPRVPRKEWLARWPRPADSPEVDNEQCRLLALSLLGRPHAPISEPVPDDQ